MADTGNPFDEFDANPFDEFDEEGTTPDEEIPMDPELEAFLKRNPDIKLTGEFADDPRVPIGGVQGRLVTTLPIRFEKLRKQAALVTTSISTGQAQSVRRYLHE